VAAVAQVEGLAGKSAAQAVAVVMLDSPLTAALVLRIKVLLVQLARSW
jgi:hypothetical protein